MDISLFKQNAAIVFFLFFFAWSTSSDSYTSSRANKLFTFAVAKFRALHVKLVYYYDFYSLLPFAPIPSQ